MNYPLHIFSQGEMVGVPPLVEQILLRGSSHVVNNYIVPGLESHLYGRKVRFFRATRKQEHFIVPHTHRYDFAACVIRGWAEQVLYEENKNGGGEQYAVSELRVGQEPGVHERWSYFERKQHVYHVGQWYVMEHDAFHSIQFSDDAIVLMLESAELSSFSYILEPVVNGQHLRTFHRADWMQK